MRDAQLLAILDAGPIGPEALAGLSRQRRQVAEAGVAALIAALDALERDPDLEDGADDEQSFGWCERGSGAQLVEIPMLHDEAEPTGDDEPSLGSLGSCSTAAISDQRQWAGGGLQDREEEDEHGGDLLDEPTLGAPENPHDQRRWAQGHGSRELDHDEARIARYLTWEQEQAVTRARREAEAILRRRQGMFPELETPTRIDATNVIPFPLDLRRAS